MAHYRYYSGYALRILAGFLWCFLAIGGFALWYWSTAWMNDWLARGQPTAMGNLETVNAQIAFVAGLCMMSSAATLLVLLSLWSIGTHLLHTGAANQLPQLTGDTRDGE